MQKNITTNVITVRSAMITVTDSSLNDEILTFMI